MCNYGTITQHHHRPPVRDVERYESGLDSGRTVPLCPVSGHLQAPYQARMPRQQGRTDPGDFKRRAPEAETVQGLQLGQCHGKPPAGHQARQRPDPPPHPSGTVTYSVIGKRPSPGVIRCIFKAKAVHFLSKTGVFLLIWRLKSRLFRVSTNSVQYDSY